MLQSKDINLRDPFVLSENGTFYMYGTRAQNFGMEVGGFDVYQSTDLVNWSEPIECFNSADNGLNREVNWAPEVHKYKNIYYMFATFTQENGNRGTYVLKADNPLGPFHKHSKGAVTPHEWECLDGTLYIEDEKPYLVFCHEHTQIIDGTICYIQLSDDLSVSIGEPTTLFSASSPYWADKKPQGEHYVSDGPFMFKTKDNTLLMIWSTFIKSQYAECVVKFSDKTIKGNFEHLPPLIDDDGGHGMIFDINNQLFLTFHSPNKQGHEHPKFIELSQTNDSIFIKNKD
jgi:GH43 family beta-xylosidase